MSVVDAAFATFYARRAEAQPTEDCADSSDFSDEDFDESQYVELDAAFADFELGEGTSVVVKPDGTEVGSAKASARTKKGRKEQRDDYALKKQNTQFKLEKERANAEKQRSYWNRLWYTSPAFPLSDQAGNPVATAPWPIKFKGNWLWEYKTWDIRYTKQEFAGCKMNPESAEGDIDPSEWHRIERCRNMVIIDTPEAPSFALFGSYTASVGIMTATLLASVTVAGLAGIVAAILADLGLVGTAFAAQAAGNTAALYTALVGSSAAMAKWSHDYATGYRKNCASFAMTLLKGYIGCYSYMDVWKSIAMPVECRPKKTMLQKGIVKPCEGVEREYGVYRTNRGVGAPMVGEKGVNNLVVFRYERDPRSEEIVKTLVGKNGAPYVTNDPEQVEYGQNYREWAEERRVKWDPAWNDAKGQPNWEVLDKLPKERGIRIPGCPTAPNHIHGFEGLALLLGNKGIPFEMYSLMHRMKDRYTLKSSLWRAGLNPAKLTGAFNSWIQRRMGHAMVGFAFCHKIEHETEEYKDEDGTKRTRTKRIRFVPCERYGVVVGGNPEGPAPVIFNTEDEEKLRAALRGEFPHWLNDQDEKEYNQYIEQLIEQAKPTHAGGWRLKDILNRIAQRTAANKNEAAFYNRLGVRINDQLHAEFMPLETIIPLAQTFYHPDYPDTHALREGVHAVISACARTPEIPVDIKATQTHEWYAEHAADYPTVAAAQAEIEKRRTLEEVAAAEVQRAAVHHNLSPDQLFDISDYLKLTWAEYKQKNEETRKQPLWWYDASRKKNKKPAGALIQNFLRNTYLPRPLFGPPDPVPKPADPGRFLRGDVDAQNEYNAAVEKYQQYLEDLKKIQNMTEARIRDLREEFYQQQWELLRRDL